MRTTVQAPSLPPGKADAKVDQQFRDQARAALNTEIRFERRYETSETGLTEMWADDMPTNSVWRMNVSVVGRSDDGSETCVYERRAQFSRAEGDATLLGSLETVGTDYESDAALDVDLAASGEGVSLQVNGSTFEMRWKAVIKINEIR